MVALHTCLTVDKHGTKEDPHKIRDTYTYVFEVVTLKDGFLVGSVTIMVPPLESMGTLTCCDTVTMGETSSKGKVPLTGGSKEKSTVVHKVGRSEATTL